jgi:glutathione S-transferase
MLKLYFAPGACSLSPHIVLRESGLDFTLERVDLGAKKTQTGADFLKINPKGYVPTLVLEDGQVLTEGPAIVQYLADKRPATNLAPPNGSFERSRLQEMLNFITSEIHKGFSPLFNPKVPDEYKTIVRDNLFKRFDNLEAHLTGREYLVGNGFTVADAYAFTVLNWTHFVKIDLGKWPNLKAYYARIAARPKVQEAMKAEGLKS